MVKIKVKDENTFYEKECRCGKGYIVGGKEKVERRNADAAKGKEGRGKREEGMAKRNTKREGKKGPNTKGQITNGLMECRGLKTHIENEKGLREKRRRRRRIGTRTKRNELGLGTRHKELGTTRS